MSGRLYLRSFRCVSVEGNAHGELLFKKRLMEGVEREEGQPAQWHSVFLCYFK